MDKQSEMNLVGKWEIPMVTNMGLVTACCGVVMMDNLMDRTMAEYLDR
jgi:hypothetical protein